MDKLRRALSGDDNESQAEQGGLQEIMDASSLSWSTRLKGFLACFVGGFLISILGSIFIFFGRYTTFGLLYSMGSLISLASTLFLMGPVKQCKNMFHTSRLIATIVMLASIVLTVYFACHVKSGGLALLFCIIQFLAMTWYSISYIPFARDAVKKTLSGICL